MGHKAATTTKQANAVKESTRPASPRLREQPHLGRLAELRDLVGNRATGLLLQAKLSISQPGDSSEQEADRVAAQIVGTNESGSTTDSRPARAAAPTGLVARRGVMNHPGEKNGHEEERGQKFLWSRYEIGGASQRFPGDSLSRQMTGGEGRPLPEFTRLYFEPRFGFDFSHVRIHTGAEAIESARSLEALAYTAGSNIVFGAGQFAPETSQGRLLLAHELTHVVQQREISAPFIQRQVDPKSEPAVVSLTVSLSGMQFTPAATATYPGGKTRYPAMAAILRRLVGPGYRSGLENEIWREIDALGLSGHGDLARDSTAKAGDPMVPFHLDIVAANALVSMLQTQFELPVTLNDHQRDLLSLGLAGRIAYSELKSLLPDWYSEYIFAREMAQREPLIRAFQKATAAGFTKSGDVHQQTLRDILKSVLPAADVLEAIREDVLLARLEPISGESRQEKEDRIYAAVQYRVIWGISEKEGPTLAGPPDGKRIREDLAVLFLGFVNTQPQLFSEAGADEGHEARQMLLARFLRFVKRVVTGKTGDEQLFKTPATATDPAWTATLTSTPVLSPPLYDAALETDHRFSMGLDFAHWTDAFQIYSYLWERIRIPEGGGQAAQDIDLEQAAGAKPRFGEVFDVRLRRARRYNAADIERIRSQTGVPFGTSARDLVQLNNVLRIGGTVIRLALERITRPRHEMQIVFPGPGLYVIRCRAVPIVEGHEEVVRAPSVAYQPVVARDPTEMAVTQVQGTVQTRFQARSRLAEIQALLQSPFPPSNREELKQEMETLRGMLAEPAEALTRRRDELKERLDRVKRRVEMRKRIAALEAQPPETVDQRQIAELHRQFFELGGPGSEFDDESLIRSLEKEFETAKNLVETREKRAKDETGAKETLDATFVADLGHSITLFLEMFDRGVVNGAREIFISDLTTADSGVGIGRATGRNLAGAEVKLAAVKAAMKDLLETSSDYGRGQVAFSVGGTIHSLRVEAGTGRIFTEALESGTMVVSIAAIAAAPFTGGASLYILLPLGVVGAIPSAYRLYTRAEASTLRFDLQTAMDVVNIVGGVVGLAHAATPLRLVRLGRVLMIAGLGSDASGILLMGAGIVQQIDALKGLPEGERAARMLEIMGNAMIQIGIQAGGSLASTRYQGHAEAKVGGRPDETPGFHLRREGEAPVVAPQEKPPAATERTMAGLGSPGGPPPPIRSAAPRPRLPEGSPERLLERLSEGVQRSLPPPRSASEVKTPAKPGTYRRGVFSADQAYHLYNEALAISAGREVAVYHNQETGEFCVRVGSEGSVGAPVGEQGWNAVVHYHPNVENVLTYRLPAPADFGGLIMRYVAEGRAVREFVEFDIPGVGRGRTEFGLEPGDAEPFYVRINMPDGSQRTVRFANDGAYQTYWGERTRYVEPGTPEYRALLDDVARYLREREGIGKPESRTKAGAGEPPAGDTQTAAGLTRRTAGPLQSGSGALTSDGIVFIRKKFKTASVEKRSVRLDTLSDERIGEIFNNQPSWLEAVVVAEARGEWLGRKTTTDFLLTDSRSDPLSLKRVGDLLEQAATAGSTGHTLNKAILDWSVWDFVHEMLRQHDPVLEPAYQLCQNHPDRAIRARWERFQLNQASDSPDLSAFFLGKVGAKRPDVVEVLLSQSEIHITDASFAYSDPIHNFKTAFYRTVLERLINVKTVTATDYRSPLRQTPVGP